MESLKISLLSIGTAVTYGILHDQVTVRLCLEYFTVGHPRILATEDPTLLALAWGTLATWWVGLLLSLPLVLLTRWGPPPRVAAKALVKPVLCLLAGIAACSVGAGLVGFNLADTALAPGIEPVLLQLPRERWAPYLAASLAHAAAYIAGSGGSLLVGLRAWRERDR